MFLIPSLLVGLLAAGIPVVIHLLHRQRTTPLRWGAMQFLQETRLQLTRRRKVENWLLMAMRIIGLAALAFLLARPLWIRGQYNPLATKSPVDVAVVIDRSLSMGRVAGSQPIFDQAVGVVDHVADLLGPSDTLSVVLAEHHPRALTALPITRGEVPKLRDQLRQLQPGLSDCSIPEAIQSARELLDRGHNLRKVILIASDGQLTSWHPDDADAWRLGAESTPGSSDRDLSVHELLLTPDAKSDLSVGDLSVQPSVVGAGLPAQISATVTNGGAKDIGPSNLRLTVNGQAIDPPQQLSGLTAGQSTTVRFDYTFTAPGSNWIKIKSDVIDALAADNEAVAAVNVWKKLPVLIIDGQLTRSERFKSSEFLVSAMQPVDPSQESATLVQPRVVSVVDSANVDLDDYFVVILNDCARLPSQVLDRLSDYAQSGHGVWIILGPRSEGTSVTDQLAVAGVFSASLKDAKPHSEQAPAATEVKDAQNPMMALIAGERGAFSAAITQKWWSLQPRDPDAGTVLATTGGDPLILERPMGRGGGRVVIWCTSVDGQWNNWPLIPNFVPLVNETIYHLSSGQAEGLDNRVLRMGEPLVWTGPAKPSVQSIDVTLPDGTVDGNKSPTLAAGRFEFRYNEAFTPGLYALRFVPTEVKPQPVYYGVGIDRRELDGRTLSAADRRQLAQAGYLGEDHPISADDLESIICRDSRDIDLWKYLAMFVLLNLLAETYVTYRLIEAQQGADVGASFAPTA